MVNFFFYHCTHTYTHTHTLTRRKNCRQGRRESIRSQIVSWPRFFFPFEIPLEIKWNIAGSRRTKKEKLHVDLKVARWLLNQKNQSVTMEWIKFFCFSSSIISGMFAFSTRKFVDPVLAVASCYSSGSTRCCRNEVVNWFFGGQTPQSDPLRQETKDLLGPRGQSCSNNSKREPSRHICRRIDSALIRQRQSFFLVFFQVELSGTRRE